MDVKKYEKNILNSIVLMGPSGVGKSLISVTLAHKANIPVLDIDDLIFFIEADLRGTLSPNSNEQKLFIKSQIKELKKLERERPLTEKESIKEEQLVHEFVDLYNYYYNLLGGFEQFYRYFYDYHKSVQKCITIHDEVYYLNKFTLQLLNKIFESTDTPFVISPPANFGWHSKNPIHYNLQLLQNKIGKFLNSTQNVLLQPGKDYYLHAYQLTVTQLIINYS